MEQPTEESEEVILKKQKGRVTMEQPTQESEEVILKKQKGCVTMEQPTEEFDSVSINQVSEIRDSALRAPPGHPPLRRLDKRAPPYRRLSTSPQKSQKLFWPPWVSLDLPESLTKYYWSTRKKARLGYIEVTS